MTIGQFLDSTRNVVSLDSTIYVVCLLRDNMLSLQTVFVNLGCH